MLTYPYVAKWLANDNIHQKWFHLFGNTKLTFDVELHKHSNPNMVNIWVTSRSQKILDNQISSHPRMEARGGANECFWKLAVGIF